MDELIAKAIAGDSAALDKVLRREHAALAAFVQSQMSTGLLARESPDDLVQDTCVRAIRDIRQFQPGSDPAASFRAWTNTIARHVVQNCGRRHARALTRLEGDIIDEHPDAGLSPSRGAAGQEALRFLAEQVERLPENWQTAIDHYYRQKKSIDDTAELMGLTRAATMQLLARARKRLRQLMGSSSLYFLPNKRRPPKDNDG